MIGDDILMAARDLVDRAIQLINGYMRYLKRSAQEDE
jgi:hypothetical protein